MDTQTEAKPVAKPKPKAKKAARAIATIPPAAATAAPTSMLQVIASAVADPRCDVGKMQALLDMQKQIEERDERKAFTRAFNALQAELPVVTKDGKIDHGDGVTAKGNKKLKTSFATYPNLMRVCGPLLKKHGFTFSNAMEPAPDGAMFIVGMLEHIEGGSRTTRSRLTADTTGGKNNQQGWGSSQQYGMRYNLIALLNIVSEAPQDVDRDGFDQPDVITAAQAKELVRLIEDAGANVDKFCKAFEISGIVQLPAADFATAKSRIATYKNTKQQRAASEFPGDKPL